MDADPSRPGDGSLWNIRSEAEHEVGHALSRRPGHPSACDLFGGFVVDLRVPRQLWLLYQGNTRVSTAAPSGSCFLAKARCRPSGDSDTQAPSPAESGGPPASASSWGGGGGGGGKAAEN